MQPLAELLVSTVMTYSALGVGFAIAFLITGIERVDSQARGSGPGFRLLIFPGVAALWPLLLFRWFRGVPDPPVESTAHRSRAR